MDLPLPRPLTWPEVMMMMMMMMMTMMMISAVSRVTIGRELRSGSDVVCSHECRGTVVQGIAINMKDSMRSKKKCIYLSRQEHI